MAWLKISSADASTVSLLDAIASQIRRNLPQPKSRALVQYIIDLVTRGFGPSLTAIAEMANHLLAARGTAQVGIKWSGNFIRRTPELKLRLIEDTTTQELNVRILR